MQGKVFLLALLVTSIAANAHLSRFFQVQYPTDLSLQKEQFDRIEENNCGSMLGKAMKDVASGAERYSRVADKFASAEIVDCRAVILNSFTLVQLRLEDEVETCVSIVPLNTLALHHKDSAKYPHVEKPYADLLKHYNTCTLKPISLPESGEDEDEEKSEPLTPQEIDSFAAGYTSYKLSKVQVDNFHLSPEDTKAVKDFVQNPGKVINDVKKIANITMNGAKVLTTNILKMFEPEQVKKAVNSADFVVAVAMADAQENKETADQVQETKDAAAVEKDADIKFSAPAQLGETARDCNQAEIARVRSLYVAASVDGRVKPYAITDENVTQCVVQDNGMRFKALIFINSFRCMLNLHFEDNKLRRFKLNKTEDPILAEHGIFDCGDKVVVRGN